MAAYWSNVRSLYTSAFTPQSVLQRKTSLDQNLNDKHSHSEQLNKTMKYFRGIIVLDVDECHCISDFL